LSSVIKLAAEFPVSEFTIISAFKPMEKENLITRVKNSGVFTGTKNPKPSCARSTDLIVPRGA
jgi:DNA-binding GntR family transcriptional regulator